MRWPWVKILWKNYRLHRWIVLWLRSMGEKCCFFYRGEKSGRARSAAEHAPCSTNQAHSTTASQRSSLETRARRIVTQVVCHDCEGHADHAVNWHKTTASCNWHDLLQLVCGWRWLRALWDWCLTLFGHGGGGCAALPRAPLAVKMSSFDLRQLSLRLLFHGPQWFIQTPPGGYNPQFSCDTPQPSEVQGGLSGGCLRGMFMWSWWKGSNTDMNQFIYFLKQIMHKIWSFYFQEYC